MAEGQPDEVTMQPESAMTAGARLAAARRAKSLSTADVSAITKIPERHIVALESGDYGALAGKSYATGFSRTYARAVGLDENEILRAVRRELGTVDVEPTVPTAFEPGDPSRVPTKRIAWIGVLLALATIAAILAFWRSHSEPAVDLAGEEFSSLAADPSASPSVTPSDVASQLPSGAAILPSDGASLVPSGINSGVAPAAMPVAALPVAATQQQRSAAPAQRANVVREQRAAAARQAERRREQRRTEAQHKARTSNDADGPTFVSNPVVQELPSNSER